MRWSEVGSMQAQGTQASRMQVCRYKHARRYAGASMHRGMQVHAAMQVCSQRGRRYRGNQQAGMQAQGISAIQVRTSIFGYQIRNSAFSYLYSYNYSLLMMEVCMRRYRGVHVCRHPKHVCRHPRRHPRASSRKQMACGERNSLRKAGRRRRRKWGLHPSGPNPLSWPQPPGVVRTKRGGERLDALA